MSYKPHYLPKGNNNPIYSKDDRDVNEVLDPNPNRDEDNRG